MIANLERFMSTMRKEKFKSLEAKLAYCKKYKNKRKLSDDEDEDEDQPKRIRTPLSQTARSYIDHHLETYISLSGDHKARNRLYKQILEQALTRKDTLDSGSWGVHTIQKRLQNALTAKNKKAAAQDVD